MKIFIISICTCIVLTIGFLALSYGPVVKRLSAHPRTENISQMRSINTALLSYYASHNQQYPDTLQQLVDENFLDQEFLELNEGRKLFYIKGLDPVIDGEKIIFYTPAEDSDDSGTVYALAAYVDGRVEVIRGYEINDILAKQGKNEATRPNSELNPPTQ